MEMRSATLLVLACGIGGSAGACGRSSLTAPSEAVSQTLSVHVTPVVLGAGEAGQASATLVSGTSTTSVTSQVTWQSTDLSIATVDAQGNVAGVSRGRAGIRGQLLALSASSALRVLSGDEISMFFAVGAGGGVKVDGSIVWTMFAGQVMTLTPRAVYDKTSISSTIYDVSPGSRATWASSDPLTVSVTSSGQVTAHVAGVADVTAIWLGQTGSVRITVS